MLDKQMGLRGPLTGWHRRRAVRPRGSCGKDLEASWRLVETAVKKRPGPVGAGCGHPGRKKII